LIREPALTEKIPPEQRFSASRLAGDLRARGLDADAYPDTDRLLEACLDAAREGDVLCVMSNGAFDNLIERLLAGL
ncbi:MAG: UDP-N-acetylmuramate:L-alanyl-gamma-D-glutamyl-meso-diaminopimelate ligase, partial [Deltaproteobacteria bacterium]|nr:UDP-N-acetylmuramate:L-alanyl-gamma-D-glutamyl-meso-diaminopimelate ligase [Deltaproteobacteria bacterium]